jgi:hypothetical protein
MSPGQIAAWNGGARSTVTFHLGQFGAQVAHSNSKMTMDVYAQLEQRVDRLRRDARERAGTHPTGSAQDPNW